MPTATPHTTLKRLPRECSCGGCVEQALCCEGPILECGSGLTTLLVGAVAHGRGQVLWTLEHLPEWSQRVQQTLDRHGLGTVQLCTSPLRSYGDFDWYTAPLERMPEAFSLIICDGPPSHTRGGRYGLAPVMASRMRPGCRILLDDAERSDEQRIATRWASELGLRLDRRGVDKPFFALESAS